MTTTPTAASPLPDNLDDLRERLRRFCAERDWAPYHTPKNLAMSVAIEAAEIMEHFQWCTADESYSLPREKRVEVANEIGDVLLYLLGLGRTLDIDIIAAARDKLALIRESATTGKPVPWVQVHKVPDYVYFNHSAHVNRGVSCVECHGKVNEMEVVRQDQPQSMSWCLDCHRAPAQRLRRPGDVFNLDSPTLAAQGKLDEAIALVHNWKVKPPQSCSGCHR